MVGRERWAKKSMELQLRPRRSENELQFRLISKLRTQGRATEDSTIEYEK